MRRLPGSSQGPGVAELHSSPMSLALLNQETRFGWRGGFNSSARESHRNFEVQGRKKLPWEILQKSDKEGSEKEHME